MASKCNKENEIQFSIDNKIIKGDHNPKWIEKNSLAKVILDTLTNYPDIIGQIDAKTGDQLSFAEMKDLGIRCAIWLRKQNIGRGDIVSIVSSTQMNDFIPLLGCVYTGFVFCPWPNELTPVEAKYFFDASKPKIIFSCEENIKMLTDVADNMKYDCQFVVIGKHEEFPALMDILAEQSQKEVESFSYYEPKKPTEELGMIFFSSGTTGNPKGTMTTLEALLNPRSNFWCFRDYSINLWYANICWSAAVMTFFDTIKHKSTRIVDKIFDPEETCKIIEKYKVNRLFISPTKMSSLSAANVLDHYTLPSLEFLIYSGAKANKLITEQFQKTLPHALILNSYGMTELGGLACCQTKNCKGVDSVGFVVEHVTLKIVDTETDSILGPNEEGEIHVKVYNKMLGYYNNLKATKEIMDEEGWIHTGDLGYYDEHGEVYITNRIKEVINTKNRKISPSKIVEILLQHPGVIDCAVVPVPHTLDGERPLAFVVKKPGYNIEPEELMILPKNYNIFYELTGGIIFIDELPLTSTGKKNINKLKALAKNYPPTFKS